MRPRFGVRLRCPWCVPTTNHLSAVTSTRCWIRAFPDSAFACVLTGDGSVRLQTATYLGLWQRHAIEDLIRDTGRVTAVRWDSAAPCEITGATSAAIDSDAFAVGARPEQTIFAPLLADPR